MEMVKEIYLTTDELEERINTLTRDETLRLKEIANTYTGNHELDADDLLQEAIYRILTGDRKTCPKDLPIVYFIKGIMKSITYDERHRYKRRVNYEDDDWQTIEYSGASSEEITSGNQVISRLEALFEDDEDVFLLILHLSEGSTPAEIQKAEEWSKTKYASVRKRMRRKWNSYSEGRVDHEKR